MEKEEIVKIKERLDDIEEKFFFLREELFRISPNEDSFAKHVLASGYNAREIHDVMALFGKATCNQINGRFNMAEFREQFEQFLQHYHPRSSVYSLRRIAEGFLAEGRAVDLCQQILDDIEKNPEKHLQIYMDDVERNPE